MRYSDPIPLARQHDPGIGWLPLKMHAAMANTDEDISRNIESALGRHYVPFNDVIGKQSGAVAVVGSGPSLKDNWQELKNFNGDILACNASFQFLLARDIVPKYMMCFDADPLMLEFITPHPDVTYLIGSRCPPKAFDMLEGCKVICWHAAGDTRVQELLEQNGKMEPMIIGGSTAITRAMIMVLPMGYTDIHLYGADSSYMNGATHIRKSTTEERYLAIRCNGRDFETAPWLAKQAEDFKKLLPIIFGLNAKIFVHGDGLIPHIAKEYGCRTDYENPVQQFCREWGKKAKILWSQL